MYTCHSAFVYDCAVCHTRCDGVSKGNYNFLHDAAFSEEYEQWIIDRINHSGKYMASKSIEPGYPDITLRINGIVCMYVEVKVQQRTFMNVQTCLPASDLMPSETIALNESDLLRYIRLEDEMRVPIIILWVLQNRLCVVAAQQYELYFQQLCELKKIYHKYGTKRRFRRRSGEGDVVNGEHKGVVVNYHFSLKEMKQWKRKH
jgi:hypothetical protein